MTGPIPIADPDDRRLDDVRRLTDVPHRRAWEDERGILVAEGPKVIRTMLAAPVTPRFVLATPKRAEGLAPAVPASVPLYVAERDVVDTVVGFRLSRGAVAAADRPGERDPAGLVAGARRLLVLEDTNDAVNLGALFRTARALRVDGVLLSRRCTDPLYRRTVRVSLGHVLHVPFARIDDVPATLRTLHDGGATVVALTPQGDVPVAAVTPGERAAVVLGAEGPGLSAAAAAAATVRARIPMADGVDSLNVAVAAGIALHALGAPARPVIS